MFRRRSRTVAWAVGATLVVALGAVPAAQAGQGHKHGQGQGHHGHGQGHHVHGQGHQHGHGQGHGHGHGHKPPAKVPRLSTVVDGLDGPRGIASIAPGKTLISEADGSFSLVVERRKRRPRVIELAAVGGGFAPAVSAGRHGWVYILTGAAEPGTPGAATLFRWRPGWDEPRPFVDIAAYQQRDPDPYDLEDTPAESNPYDVLALRDGTVLVADAANNDLLRVDRRGRVRTVARLKPRTVGVPQGLPATDPDGNPLPPAGAMIASEAVATSIAEGKDGDWYVGELRGFPATPGTSQIWRIKRGSLNATCDPARPSKGRCTRHLDGLTSIVDLSVDRRGDLYALSLSKLSWLAMELQVPGAEIGGLFRIDRQGRGEHRIREVVPGRLVMPGGVAAAGDGSVYVVGPVFGPGALMRIR